MLDAFATKQSQPYCYTTKWTDERVERLKEMWAEGLSCSQIAAELGGGLTRNAVIGKVTRLGLPLRKKNRVPQRRPHSNFKFKTRKPKRIEGKNAARVRPVEDWKIEPEPYVQDTLVDAEIPIAQRKTLMELTDQTCRWPVGDVGESNFFFCGAMPTRGKPYCAAHCARASGGIVRVLRPQAFIFKSLKAENAA